MQDMKNKNIYDKVGISESNRLISEMAWQLRSKSEEGPFVCGAYSLWSQHVILKLCDRNIWQVFICKI